MNSCLETSRLIDKAARTEELVSRLVQVWESSVRATHHFLAESDIQHLKPMVSEVLRAIEILVVAFEGDVPVGFMGIQDQKIEALFMSPAHIGKGIGKQLIRLGIYRHRAVYIDVNEQNSRAAGIYRHLGFEVFQRDEMDDQGNPFPILRMKLKRK